MSKKNNNGKSAYDISDKKIKKLLHIHLQQKNECPLCLTLIALDEITIITCKNCLAFECQTCNDDKKRYKAGSKRNLNIYLDDSLSLKWYERNNCIVCNKPQGPENKKPSLWHDLFCGGSPDLALAAHENSY